MVFRIRRGAEIGSVFFDFKELVEADAATIFKSVEEIFDQNGIPWENLIGFGSDGAPVMRGKKNSVLQRLK